MPSVFVVSDTHFGHTGVCRFLRNDGTKLRPWDSAEEMDEAMVKAWNETVKPTDKVYHLGDVVINRKALSIMHRLNGDKILIKGNHDIFKPQDYAPHFRDVRAYQVMTGAGVILSHMPVHPNCLYRFGLNIHGHLHANRVTYADPLDGLEEKLDTRYYCVSVEHTDFRPILFEEVLKRSRAEGGEPGLKGPATTWPAD